MRLAVPAAIAASFATVVTFAISGLLPVPGAFAEAVALPVAAPAALPVAAPSALPEPSGPVVLTVSGALGAPPARFDAAMLDALPQRAFSTSTIWTEGVSAFSGVELRTLLDRLGIGTGTLKITAVNDYSVQIPVADIAPGGALLANRRDGKPMSLRDKGPLWVVYPYDSSSDFRNEVIYSRSVWQVDRIEVLP